MMGLGAAQRAGGLRLGAGRTRLAVPAHVFAAAAAAWSVAVVPFWWHVLLVDPGFDDITTIFSSVGVYASDLGLLALAALAIARPRRLERASATLALGLAALAVATLVSSIPALNPRLAAGVAAQVALLALAWLGLRFQAVSPRVLIAALVSSACLQALLAVAQFALQQPLVPDWLGLPWLPSADASLPGSPVVLAPDGTRLLRGFGTFPHPNVLGGYLALALVLLPALRLERRWRGPRPQVGGDPRPNGSGGPRPYLRGWLVGAVLVLGLLASFSRAGAVAAFLGLLVWFWNSRQHLQRGLLAALVLAGLVLVSPLEPLVQSRLLPRNPLERGSVEDRLALDRSALSEGRAHLPLGTGAENYGLVALAEDRQEVFGEPVPNLALLIGAELGIPGVLALLLLGLGVWLSLRTAGPGGRAALAALVAVVVLGMLDHYLWTMPPARLMAWLPLALLAATRTRKVTHDL